MTDDRFEALLASALSDPEIDEALRRRQLAVEEVAANVRARKEKLLGEFRGEELEEASAEVALLSYKTERKSLERSLTAAVVPRGFPPRIVSLIVRRRLALYRRRGMPSTDAPWKAFEAVRRHVGPRSRPTFRGSLPSALKSLGDVILFLLFRFAIERRVYERRGSFTSDADRLDHMIETARVQRENAVAATDRAVTRRLLAELRVQINAVGDNSRSVLLPPVRPTGLAEVFDVRYEIPTEAKQDVLRLLRTMPGGAIGVSGPRGAGKSTLLRAIATGVSEIELGDEVRPVIGVLTSAPVQYDGRDFLLHLFANTCTRIVGGTRGTPRVELSRPEPQWVRFMPMAESVIRLMIVVALVFGTVELALGTAALSGAALVQTLQAKPIDLLTRGFFWLFAALVFGRALRSARAHAAADALVPPPAPPPVPMPARWAGGPESWNAVVTTAREWLAEIRFQRSYSQGWSGSLKLPVGVEGSVNQAFSWSQRQLSLPELAKAYIDFVSDVAAHAVVVIAIDELDKIGSDAKAHEFLNEIKAVFGIERCFYLLSVSDSAMSSFARRGLPVRDAFDSALDEVVRVEYLTLDAANELLARRIIRFPLPFVSFCHCLSGGLPRDVIRACRDVFDAAEGTPSRALRDVARAVLQQDLRQKIAATVTAVQQSEGSDDATPIIDSLGCLAVETLTSTRLLNDYSDIVDSAATATSAVCRSLAIDLAAYFLYAATLLEVFDGAAAGDTWSDQAQAETFDELANLRRRLEIDSDACRGAILRLRSRAQLAAPRAEASKPTAARLPRRYLPRLSVKRAEV